ncbi:hypothetical protein CANCADRAFT_137067 [Tortispora caseinolytica NRRL Y-17796]|uniref:ABC transporter domain-containing protein n=1 Tax=Tortispora caseinolytica NRRL Y-17796 TaxID=767744 RepID=A0A1E4TBZ7_9ASCO|nr:hypothetical protein CANCADRAFT_137067 [Tortispora caseinolytica NRRL Y-17796]
MDFTEKGGLGAVQSAIDMKGNIDFGVVDPVEVVVSGVSVYKEKSRISLPLFRRFLRKSPPEIDDANDIDISITRPILSNVSCEVGSGKLMALIGSSGSGKTTLLNTMASRMSGTGLKVNGSILFNGKPSMNSVRSGYVLQQDVLPHTLTPRETLRFSADLRLPASVPRATRYQMVEQVIAELGLRDCADTRIGNVEHKGISGGEKRRVSIGIQMLANPSVLFLDEPTTGLDAFSAYQLVRTLSHLAKSGRTIICSIHQPRSDIFYLFDSVTLLARGQTVYSGPTKEIISYFEELGYAMPMHVNPADFIIDISSIDFRSPEAEERTMAQVEKLLRAWRSHSASSKPQPPNNSILDEATASSVPDAPPLSANTAPFSTQLTTLIRRGFLTTFRDPFGMFGLLFAAIFVGGVNGWIFYGLDGSIQGMRSMTGAAYISITGLPYLDLLYEIYRLSNTDMPIFDREYSEGIVTVSGWLIARRFTKLLMEDIPTSLIYSVLMYFLVGFRTDSAKYFFVYFADVFFTHMCAIGLATMAVAISRDFSVASLIGNLSYTLQSVANGFFIAVSNMPVYVRWTRWITFTYFSFGLAVSNQFSGYVGDCPYPPNSSECFEYLGDTQLAVLGVPVNWLGVPLGVLAAWTVGFFIIAGLVLRFYRRSVSVASANISPAESDIVNDSQLGQVTTSRQSISISIQSLSLIIVKRTLPWKKTKKVILQDVSTSFQSGCLSAILGPSGSGKSSFLNFLADRCHSTALTKYESHELLMLNGQKSSPKLLSRVCSYVTQDDDGLLPSLTVRETLTFAAYLRLPKTWSKDRMRQRAEEIMHEMGLKDCADKLIGSEFTKGISGGEKRRVSIAVQLLSDPSVIFLDEPTSGLDSFTAGSILQVLKNLAMQGKNVICTIHQPRFDMFNKFDKILLLTKGGYVAYSGDQSTVLDYFSQIGFHCPSNVNIADFLLDLVAVNLQDEQNEKVTRDRLDNLLDHWRDHSTEYEPIVSQNTQLDDTELLNYKKEYKSLHLAFLPLLQRSILNFKRRSEIMIARMMQILGLGIVFLLFYTPMHYDYRGAYDRIGLVQQYLALYFCGMLNNIAVYPDERNVFYREHDDNVYGVLPFFLCYLTIELPFEILASALFAAIAGIAPGITRSAAGYFASFAVCFGMANCGESIGIIFNTLVRHIGFAVNLISVVLSTGAIMSGVLSLNMQGFLKGINYISPAKYGAETMLYFGFQDVEFSSCYTGDYSINGEACTEITGAEFLQTFGYDADGRVALGGLMACVVVYRFIAFVILRVNRMKLNVQKSS